MVCIAQQHLGLSNPTNNLAYGIYKYLDIHYFGSQNTFQSVPVTILQALQSRGSGSLTCTSCCTGESKLIKYFPDENILL